MTVAPEVLFACAVSALATAVLAPLAARLRWTDDPTERPERKVQARAVPAVGGLAILVALIAARAIHPRPWTLGSAIAVGFLFGFLDDRVRGGVAPLVQLVGQLVVGALLVGAGFTLGLEPRALDVALSVAAVVVTLCVANTFDNADGALVSLASLGLGFAAPVASAAVAGFLPFNLWLRRRDGTPIAYLGNSGSQLLGVLLLVEPRALPILLLPALDLARLSVVRARRGVRPWIGDRRHLAHRLQACGFGPTATGAVLVAIGAPALLGVYGAGTTVVLFVAAVLLTPDVP